MRGSARNRAINKVQAKTGARLPQTVWIGEKVPGTKHLRFEVLFRIHRTISAPELVYWTFAMSLEFYLLWEIWETSSISFVESQIKLTKLDWRGGWMHVYTMYVLRNRARFKRRAINIDGSPLREQVDRRLMWVFKRAINKLYTQTIQAKSRTDERSTSWSDWQGDMHGVKLDSGVDF